jgi:hypothetical protein
VVQAKVLKSLVLKKIQMKFKNNAVRFMHGEENDSNMFRYQNYFMALLQVINL